MNSCSRSLYAARAASRLAHGLELLIACDVTNLKELARTSRTSLLQTRRRASPGLRGYIALLEREGRVVSAARDTLEMLEARLELVLRHRGVVLRLLEVAKRQKGGRRAAGVRIKHERKNAF